MRFRVFLAILGVGGFGAHACDLCGKPGTHTLPAPSVHGGELLQPITTAGGPLSVPPISSRPAARAKLYLDFDGDYTSSWINYSPGTTTAYTADADPTTFTPTELSNIQKIWSGIAEKYSPFDIDVTTVAPPELVKGQSFRIVIGGNGAWYNPALIAGGIAYLGSFYNELQTSSAYVFSDLLLPNDPLHTSFVTAASSHEAGHGFGLQHQSVWSQSGQLLDQYNRGDAFKAPIMGSSYRKRGIWWEGTSLGPTTIQDDLTVLSNANNRFGYRLDDHSNMAASATPLNILNDNAFGGGVIERINDVDFFSFDTFAGTVSFTLNVAPYDAMLDGSLALYNISGDLLQSVDTATLGETLSLSLPEGSYRLAVLSHGSFGDIGQYSLTGSIIPIPEPAAFAMLASAALRRRRPRVPLF
jgi:hypothetical protein